MEITLGDFTFHAFAFRYPDDHTSKMEFKRVARALKDGPRRSVGLTRVQLEPQGVPDVYLVGMDAADPEVMNLIRKGKPVEPLEQVVINIMKRRLVLLERMAERGEPAHYQERHFGPEGVRPEQYTSPDLP